MIRVVTAAHEGFVRKVGGRPPPVKAKRLAEATGIGYL
jgi:hypothetical protein